MNETVMMSRQKKTQAHLGCGLSKRRSGTRRLGPLEMLVRVLDHHDRSIHHGADRDRNATRLMMLEPTKQLHRAKRHQNAYWQHENGNECASDMQQEHDTDRVRQRRFPQ